MHIIVTIARSYNLQSANFKSRQFIHNRAAMNIVDQVSMTTDTAMRAGASDSGSTKLGTTPGGGIAAGSWQRSVPGGIVRLLILSEACFFFPFCFSYASFPLFSSYQSRFHERGDLPLVGRRREGTMVSVSYIKEQI